MREKSEEPAERRRENEDEMADGGYDGDTGMGYRINTTEEDIIHEYERKRWYVISTVFKVSNVMDCIVRNARHSLYVWPL